MRLDKNIIVVFLYLLLVNCTNSPKPIADSRQNDYALYDENGGFHRFSTYNNNKAIVLFVQGNGCPIVRNALTDFHAIVNDFSEKGFTFFMVNSNIQDSKETVKKEATEFNFKVPVLLDKYQLIAEELDITITAEVIILHPTTRQILYRGPINNRLDYESQKIKPTQTYLRDALLAILKKKKPTREQEVTRGCKVTRLSVLEKEKKLTYTKDIAPILVQNCVQCHRDDGIAPWSMKDYQTITGWSAMIKEVLLSRRMPPTKLDPTIGEFSNVNILPDSNRRKIIKWINNGLEPGIGKDILVNIPQKDTIEWQGGIPDKIITIKEETIPASELIPYRIQNLPLDLDKDVWLKGIEIKPDNKKVVHHVVVTNLSKSKENPILKRNSRKWLDDLLGVSGDGQNDVTFYPNNSGKLLKKEDKIIVQLHYTPSGKVEKDKTRIGLYFHDSIPQKEHHVVTPFDTKINIVPHAKNHKEIVYDSITKNITLYSIFPHMHYRGKSIRTFVNYPNGKKKLLLSVPDYNFNWQQNYILKEPLDIPAGSKLIVEGTFDNSYQNPINPDPNVEVSFGRQSYDEMLCAFFSYTIIK